MAKLYSYTYMSLDGVMSSPETWTPPYFSKELQDDLTRRLKSSAAMVLGGQTYKEFADFWPKQNSNVPFADLNNGIRKYVVSKSHDHAEWNNSSIVTVDDLSNLKSKGNLHVTGSGTLVRSLLETGALDEIVIIAFPVVLGDGKRMFTGIEKTGLNLVNVTSFPDGVQSTTYRSASAA